MNPKGILENAMSARKINSFYKMELIKIKIESYGSLLLIINPIKIV
jgi:hypothetical protein